MQHHRNLRRSGVEWLGGIPAHWDIQRLKYVASINDEALPETTSPDYEFSYVDIGSVDAFTGIKAVEECTFEDAPSRARRVVRSSDTIVSTVRTYLRAIAPIDSSRQDLIVSTGFAVVRPRRITGRFLAYALRENSFVETIVARSVGVSYPAINASEIGTIPIPLPPREEQLAISDFLDCKTTEIDALIAKKHALIEKLKEKRSALISRTVTRGLPPEAAHAAGFEPNPKMKPSGIEWLGRIPEHWQVKKVKYITSIRYGLGEPPEYSEDGIPLIRATDIKRGRIDLATVRKIRPEDIPWARGPQLGLKEILIVRSGAYTGDSAIITEESAGSIAGFDMVLTVKVLMVPEFVAWVFLSKYMLEGQIHLERMRAAQPHLNAEELGGFAILVPPTTEQRSIADFLDRETAKIDSLVANVEQAIERLQEYRTALITAAVTGKIDVRQEQCPPAGKGVHA